MYFYLLEHPEIFLCPKEKHLLSEDIAESEAFPTDLLQRYEDLFEGASPGQKLGEVAIQYLCRDSAARNIKRLMPQARLIALLRNPVDRTLSDFLMHCRLGDIRTRDGTIVDGNPEPAQIEELLTDTDRSYVDRSLYFKHLSRYYKRFPADQIHVCLLEDLKRDGLATMQLVFDFIGVDPAFRPDTSARYNVGKARGHNRLLLKLRKNETLKGFVSRYVPRPMLDSLQKARKRWEASGQIPVVKVPPATRDELLAYFRDDIGRLEELLGRDLSHWRNPALAT
jgi:hypothetical protein